MASSFQTKCPVGRALVHALPFLFDGRVITTPAVLTKIDDHGMHVPSEYHAPDSPTGPGSTHVPGRYDFSDPDNSCLLGAL